MSSRRISALFTWRGQLVGESSDATALERHVGLTLSLHMSERGDSAFPSVETLAAECGRSPSTVRGALRELERKGWLTTQKRVGRGHTNVYEATVPDTETHLTQSGFAVGDAVVEHAQGGPGSAADAAAGGGAHEGADKAETHRTPSVSSEAKHDGEQAETRRDGGLNPPDPGDKDVRGRHEDENSSSTAADTPAAAAAAAGGGLVFRLRRHRIGGTLLAEAIAHPERAEAWLTLAEKEATDNAAGYFRTGMLSGDLPSDRGAAAGKPPEERRRAQLETLIRNLGAEHGADEARWLIDNAWSTLTSVERGELHLLVDELVSDRLPPAATDETEVEVA